ncbi:MAG: type II toxin-antitoxin system VapC family toxin [Paludibacteraceae bacterium]|nr:type II toxin-antitoxin system VapC family toxin [Paludibacteraceae bacterium]
MTARIKPYNPNHIFVDTNVIIGAYCGDGRHQVDEECLRYLFSLNGKRLFISSLSVAQLISMFQKKRTNDEVVGIVRQLQHRFSIISFTNNDIDDALVETGADIEDNVQYVMAKKQKCRIIVTNNIKDYRLLMGIEAIKPSKIRIISR